jgi:NB-ARC domain/TIR domain
MNGARRSRSSVLARLGERCWRIGIIGIPMSTLFLSYARGDDEPFVERLYHDLSSHGFDIWWDRVSMPGRALTFLQEIRDGITARDRLVLVVGPKAVTSDYVRAEWLYALEIGKAINPVLRLGDYDRLPDELKLLDAPDFRDDAHHAARLETLVRQLSEPVAPMGRLIAVPSLPPHFLRRQDRLRALKDAVLADLHRPVVITGTAVRTGIHGMGGIGKSVLASALARDHEVRRAFPDGVYWVGIGQNPMLVTLQRRVAQALGDPGHFDNEPQGKGKLHGLLEHKAVMLVLDDVWDPTHAEAFDVLGPRCRAVITTRDAALITSLGGTSHPGSAPHRSGGAGAAGPLGRMPRGCPSAARPRGDGRMRQLATGTVDLRRHAPRRHLLGRHPRCAA